MEARNISSKRNKAKVLLPRLERILAEVGSNIRLARLRRKLSASQVSERAGISRRTYYSIENGEPTVKIGAYLQVLFVLNLEKELLKMARDDEFGRKLQDARISTKRRAPKKP